MHTMQARCVAYSISHSSMRSLSAERESIDQLRGAKKYIASGFRKQETMDSDADAASVCGLLLGNIPSHSSRMSDDSQPGTRLNSDIPRERRRVRAAFDCAASSCKCACSFG